ncbi:MAG: InlB B-repeat-containing protein [Lachnospiraceae bacterium]|nr:InlB B-repeat-containing protein [Lachnospiraceae bacterium]
MGHSEDIKHRTDPNYLYLADKVTGKEDKKPYVFISYKSDDDKIVLSTIVYHLVKERGLKVYFDASFDDHNAIWVEQFQKNMESQHCKGVIAFISKKYTVSYATLMELMHSQSTLVTINKTHPSGTGYGIPVVPVNLEELTDFDDDELEKDTGLGKEGGNPNARLEKEVFDEDFNELVKLKTIVITSRLGKKNELTWRDCNRIFNELYGKLKVNSNNYYEKNERFYDALEKTIRNGIGDEVFEKSDIKEEKVIIKFKFDNEEKEIEIIKGNKVDAINHVNKEGYTFIGWFDTKSNKKWDFSDSINDNITLIAKWEKLQEQADEFLYELWNEKHTAKSLAVMMHDVFDLIASKYPSKVAGIAANEGITSVALKKSVDEKILPQNKLSYFRGKKEHKVLDELYYVGTSYNREQGISQLEKILKICEGNSDALKILAKPGKVVHEKSGKEGLEGILR